LRDYLSYMRTQYVPRRITGDNDQKLSSKSIRNIYISLCAFSHWMADEFQITNPTKSVPAPKFTMRRATGRRDPAIIFTLIDSGLRATELCSFRIAVLDSKTEKITIRHGVNGGAKGGKARFVYLGKTARKAVWRYLADREDGETPDSPLILGKAGSPLNKDSLRQVIHAIGEKAGIAHAYPHRFRHSFAIQYLRSGGDIFTLKNKLGNSSLEMVQHYARIADIDVQEGHRKANRRIIGVCDFK